MPTITTSRENQTICPQAPDERNKAINSQDTFKIVVSDTAMYQQAGNSIVVDVLIALLKQMDITQYGE